jgi:hypothetical protein
VLDGRANEDRKDDNRKKEGGGSVMDLTALSKAR